MATDEEKIVRRLLANPKVLKAMEGMLKPLKKKGDKLTIKASHKEEK